MSKRQQLIDYLIKYTPTPIVWLFLLQATAAYVSFGIVDPLTPGFQMLLFEEMFELMLWVPVVWGIIGVVSVVMEFVGVAFDNALITRVFAYLQVALWFFAGIVYLKSGLVMLFLIIALPQMLFWMWNQTVRYDHARVVGEVKRTFKHRA